MKTGALIVGLTCIMALHAPAQQPDKVEQYRGMLLKRPENSVLFGRLVDAWLENGEMAGLKDLLERKAAEGGAMDWRLLAVFRNFSGDEAGALAALDEALKKTPDDAQTRLARAKALGAATRFDDALADLAVVAKDKTLAMEAGTLRGKFLARAGRPAEAVKAWQEIIAANPADEGLREDLIELEIGEGMLEEAVAAARELAEKTADPYQKALRRMRVAEILAQAGNKNEAVAGYREVFAVSAENSWLEREVLARVNALFAREDDTSGLRGFYDQLRDAYPRRVAVKKEAARSLMASGDGDEAVAMFREVLKVLPGDREVRDEFIALLESAGRNKDAADEITALLATADKDAALWEKLASIRKAMGDQVEADKALDKAIALVPAGEPGGIAAAALYERFGRSDDAERVLRETVKTHGSAGEAGDALAVLLASHGKPDEAVALWRAMAEKADREGLLRIARSLTASGHAADAYAILASRMGAFEGDPLLLAALCQAAQFSDKSEDAIPQAMELVRQAKTTGDLENALRQAVAIISRAKEPRKWLDELAAKPNPTTQELCLLAEMHESLGDSIEAEKVLQKAISGGDPLLAAAQRVRLLELRGDLPAAIRATREWLALPGGLKTEQVKRLVGLLERSGETEAALKETENWKRIAPGDKLAWSKRAELLQADGRATDAVAELRRALAKFGNEEEVRATLAESLKQAGLFDEAWRMIHALYDESESPQSKLKWAGSLADMAASEGKEEEVINDFKRRARENPSSIVPMLALAEMYRQWQRPDEELQIIAEASRRKPDDDMLLQRLADLEEQSGSKEKAEAVLKAAIRLRDTPDNRRRLSAFWFRNGEVERGLNELLSSKAAANPRDVERLVTPLITAKDWDNALKVLNSEAPRHPDDWRLGYLQAYVLSEAGKKEEAFVKFAALLGARGDLPGVQPLIPAQQMQWFEQNEDEGSFIGLFQRFRRITDRDPRRAYFYQGMGQAGLPLPGTLIELQWMSLCNAFSIANEKPETRDAMLAGLNGGDIPGLDFLKSVQALKPAELRERVLAEDADPQLFRWYLVSRDQSGPDRNDQNPDAELFRKAAGRFAKTDPQLALGLLAQLPSEGKDGIGPDGARTMFDLLAGLDAEKRGNMIHMLHGLAFAKEKDVPQDVRKKAEAMLLADIKTADDDPRTEWISMQLGLDLLRAGRAEEAANWLNEFHKQSNDPARKARLSQFNPYGMYGHGGSPSWMRGGDNESLQFPEVLHSRIGYPWQSEFQENNRSEKVSAAERKLLDLLGEKNGGHPAQEEREEPIPADAVVAIIPKLTDPYLRVFLAHHSGKPGLLEQEIASLEKSHADDAAALQILAAYFTTIKKDAAKAYALLASASRLPRTNELRDEIDWNLYQTGLAFTDKPPAGLDLDPARQAALRLRKKVSADEDAKARLAQGMVKLGLEEESRRYTAAPAAFARGSSPFSGMGRRSSSSNSLPKTLAKLMAEGKRDAAARKLLTEIRRLKSASSSINNPGYSNYELNQAQELITSLKLENEMMKISAPPEGAGFNSRRDYALLLAGMKKNEQALPLLRTLSAEKKDDLEVNAALLMAMPKEEQKSFVLTLPDGKFDADRIGNWFNSILENDDKYEELMANVGLLVMFLEKLPPSFEADRNLSWVNYKAKDLFRDSGPDDVKLRSFLAAGNPTDKIDQDRTKARDALALRLYQAMLRHPQTSEQGFILMHSASTALAIPEADLDAAALAAFSLGSRLKEDSEMAMRYGNSSSQMRWMWRTQGGGSRSGGEPGGGLDPMAYLLRRSTQVKNLDPFTPGFLAELGKADPEKAQMLGECVRITSAQGVSAFQKWKDAPPAEAAAASTQLLAITRLAALKNRSDILDAVLEFTCEKAPAQDPRNPYGGFVGNQEVQQLLVSSAKDLAARTRIIERITRQLLGPPEAWELYGKMDENRGVYVLQIRRQLYQQFCQGFRGNADASVALARFVGENRLGTMADLDLGSQLGQGVRNADPAMVAKSWLASGIFAPGPALLGSSDDDGKLLIDSLKDASSYMNSDIKKKLGEILLKTEGDNRFWARIFGAVYADKPDVAIAEINASAAAIGKWPAPDRNAFARWVLNRFPAAAISAADPIRRLLAESRKTGDTEMRKLAETYLKDGFPEDLQPYSLDDKLGGMLRALLTDNPELASRLWLKLQEQFQNNSSLNSSNNGFNRAPVQYVNSELLDALDDGDFSLSGLALFMHHMEKARPGSTFGFFEFGNSYYFNRIMDAHRSRLKGAYEADKSLAAFKPELRTFAGTLMTLGRDTPPEARPILAALLLQDALYDSPSFDSNTRGQLRKWSREELAKLDPALSNAAFIILRPTSSSEIQDPLKSNLRDSARAILTNSGIPVGMRVHILAVLAERNSPPLWNIDPEWYATVADLLPLCAENSACWQSSEITALFLRYAEHTSVKPEAAAKLLAAFKANMPEISGSDPGDAREKMSRILIMLAIRSGNAEELDKQIKGSGDLHRGTISMILQLWKSGQNAAAVSLLARPGEHHKGMRTLLTTKSVGGTSPLVFSKETEAAMPGWLASIPDAGQRFRLECLISSWPDAWKERAPKMARPARIAALAKRFAAEAPKPRVSRNECLAALSREPDSSMPLAAEYREAAGKQTLIGLVPLREDSESSPEVNATYVTEALLNMAIHSSLVTDGNADYALSQLTLFDPMSMGDLKDETFNLMYVVSPWFSEIMLARMAELPPEQRKVYGPQALEIFKHMYRHHERRGKYTWKTFGIASQAMVGNSAAVPKLVETMPEWYQKNYPTIEQSSIDGELSRLLRTPSLGDKAYSARCVALMEALLSDVEASRVFFPHMTRLPYLISSNAITKEEVISAIHALPENHPRRAEFLCAKAEIIGGNKGTPGETLAAYDAAEAAAGADAKMINFIKAYRVIHIDSRIKDREKALEIAKTIPLDQLPEKERKSIEAILKRGQAAKPKP